MEMQHGPSVRSHSLNVVETPPEFTRCGKTFLGRGAEQNALQKHGRVGSVYTPST